MVQSLRSILTYAAAISVVAFAAVTAHASLQQGDKGEKVKTLQQLLKLKKADGKFGPSTKKAVVAFQKKKGIEADGVVGRSTWSKLVTATPTLRVGSKGQSVRVLQTLIADHMPDAEVAIDGKFGQDTKADVIEVQKQYDLKADGVAGKKTWDKLKD